MQYKETLLLLDVNACTYIIQISYFSAWNWSQQFYLANAQKKIFTSGTLPQELQLRNFTSNNSLYTLARQLYLVKYVNLALKYFFLFELQFLKQNSWGEVAVMKLLK